MSGSLSIDFFAFNLLLAMLVMPLRMLGMWVGQAQRATAAGERIFEILDEPEEIADGPGARPITRPRRAVVFEDVDFGYEPGRAVLDGVDLEIAPGRTVADRPRARANDARRARAPLLRRDRGARPRRRRRRPRPRTAVAPA